MLEQNWLRSSRVGHHSVCPPLTARSTSSPKPALKAKRTAEAGIVSHPLVKIILLGLSWAYLHHFTAGIRNLFMDNHFALDKDAAQSTARWVLIISLLLTAIVGLKLFGVF